MKNDQSKKIEQLHDIFEKTREGMYKIAYRFFQDTDVSDDIVQEAYMKIYDKLPMKFNHEAQLLKWCSVICRNLCIDYYRKKIRNRRLIDKIAIDFGGSISKSSSPEDDLTNLILQDIIEKILNQISGKERMIYTMYAYSTFSIREIAVMSGRGLSSVRTLIRKINKRIKDAAVKSGLSPINPS